jgi:hypothetical protein
MIMREIRPDSGRELLTIMGKVSDQRSAFMIVSGKTVRNRPSGPHDHGTCRRLASYTVIVIRPARER